MKLNGWQRLGLIASVCWVVVGGMWVNGHVIDDLGAPIVATYRRCLDSRSVQSDGTIPKDTDWASCTAAFNRDFGPAVTNHWVYAAAYTLIPIPIVWLVAYGIALLFRWVRVGFKYQE